MKAIAILGSTGSIGTQTLEVVRANGDIQVTALAAGSNIVRLEEQVREFLPKLVCVWQKEQAEELRGRVRDLSVRVVCGMEGLIEAATEPLAEIVVTAVVGMIGIRPTIAAIEAGKDIALANKETLVTAGHLIMPLAEKNQVNILPVDSEHSAVFQALHGENKKEISRILLTASGGPFRGRTMEQMKEIRPEDALKHPNWVMGKKITIDSATMVNKGLEVMEAKWLFGVKADQIEVVVQPQSIIHSMVEFVDGGIIAQLGTPDMKLPIQYALYYPQRRYLAGMRLDFTKLGQITLEAPDLVNFRGLALAYQALLLGGNVPTIFNAANELAVRRFLDGSIRFLEISEIIEASMQAISYRDFPSVEQILETEQETYEWIESRW